MHSEGCDSSNRLQKITLVVRGRHPCLLCEVSDCCIIPELNSYIRDCNPKSQIIFTQMNALF